MWAIVGCGWLAFVGRGVQRRRRAHHDDRLGTALATLRALETYAGLPRQRATDQQSEAPAHPAHHA